MLGSPSAATSHGPGAPGAGTGGASTQAVRLASVGKWLASVGLLAGLGAAVWAVTATPDEPASVAQRSAQSGATGRQATGSSAGTEAHGSPASGEETGAIAPSGGELAPGGSEPTSIGSIGEERAAAGAPIPSQSRRGTEDTRAQPEDTRAQPEDSRAQPEDTRAQPEDSQAQPGRGTEDAWAQPRREPSGAAQERSQRRRDLASEEATRARQAAGAPTEAELLERAQRSLRSDPEGALELVRRAEARYPGGSLQEERAVVRIDALLRLGRIEDAKRRGEAFLRAHPDSVYRAKIERDLTALSGGDR
jgi:hypothetical protein